MALPLTCLLDKLAPSETFIWREIELLQQAGWQVQTLFLSGEQAISRSPLKLPPDWSRKLCRAAAPRITTELIRSPLTALRIITHLPQALRLAIAAHHHKSQLIHAQFAGITADLAAIAATTASLPWSCAVHAYDVFTPPPKLLHRRLSTATAITACTHLAGNAVLHCGIPSDKLHIIRHGLPLHLYPFTTTGRQTHHIFVASRLTAKKGLDSLIHACAILHSRGHPVTCSIAGTGAELKNLKQLTHKLALDQHISWHGWLDQSQVRDHLATATIMVLPSRRLKSGDSDGMANIIVESLALGTPVITTTAGAATEILTHNQSALLVPPDNPQLLAQEIERLLASPELHSSLAAAGRQTAELHLDGRRNIKQLKEFFSLAATLQH